MDQLVKERECRRCVTTNSVTRVHGARGHKHVAENEIWGFFRPPVIFSAKIFPEEKGRKHISVKPCVFSRGVVLFIAILKDVRVSGSQLNDEGHSF